MSPADSGLAARYHRAVTDRRGQSSDHSYTDRRRLLFRSNFGREFGWSVQHLGSQVAQLDEAHWVDQFWFSYRITLSDSNDDRPLQPAFWEAFSEINLVNMRIGESATGWFPTTLAEGGRISIRGDGLRVGWPKFPWPWEK